jgi:hypothetical protein
MADNFPLAKLWKFGARLLLINQAQPKNGGVSKLGHISGALMAEDHHGNNSSSLRVE